MLFNVGVQPEGPYLLVTGSGDAQFPELCALADFIAAVARRRGSKRALFDLLALCPQLSTDEHEELGAHIASTLAQLERVAVVLWRIEDTVAAELAGYWGLRIRTFATLEAANSWLQSDD